MRAVGLALLASAQTSVVSADESATSAESNRSPSVEELVKLKQNPVSGLKQLLFQANVAPNYPDSGETPGIYSLQAVWPFSISEDYRLVSYSILPYINVPGSAGASAGAISGALTDVGINDGFMKDLAATFNNGSSLLFVLVRKVTSDKVLEDLQGSGGKVIKTSLTHEDEGQLQAALDAAKGPAAT